MAEDPSLRQSDAAAAVHPSPDATEPARPLLRVVRGNPTPEELAALIAVVSARGAAVEDDVAPVRSRWSEPQLRRPLTPGPGAWRASALPC